jgi:hypothetical protein
MSGRRQPLGIGGHLEQRRHLEPAGQLGVGDVIRPVAEITGPMGAQQEICLTSPLPVIERPLVDHVHPGTHRGESLLLSLDPAHDVVASGDLGDYSPLLS